MLPFRAYILAGGLNSRFGSDKARAQLGGTPLVRRIADAAMQYARDVAIVAAIKDQYADLGIRTIADNEPGNGPLGGLQAALIDASSMGSEWIFLASCDLIELKQTWIERLTDHCTGSAEFVAFRGSHWEPLVACYHTSLIPRVSKQLRERNLAMWKLLESSTGVTLPLPADWPAQVQANTPGELAAATALAERLTTITISMERKI